MEIQKKIILNFFNVQGWGTGVILCSGFCQSQHLKHTNKSWAEVILLRIWSKFLPIFIRNMMCNVLWRWSNKVDPWHYGLSVHVSEESSTMICTWKRAFKEFEGWEFMLSWSFLNLVFTYWKDLAPWLFVTGKRALKHLEGLDSGVQAVSWCALDKWVGEVKRVKQDISTGARHYTCPPLKFHGHHQPNASCSSAHLLHKEEHTFMFWCTTRKNPIFVWCCKEKNSNLASPWCTNNLPVAYISKHHITSTSSFTSLKKELNWQFMKFEGVPSILWGLSAFCLFVCFGERMRSNGCDC